jgi:hypothetical protein
MKKLFSIIFPNIEDFILWLFSILTWIAILIVEPSNAIGSLFLILPLIFYVLQLLVKKGLKIFNFLVYFSIILIFGLFPLASILIAGPGLLLQKGQLYLSLMFLGAFCTIGLQIEKSVRLRSVAKKKNLVNSESIV